MTERDDFRALRASMGQGDLPVLERVDRLESLLREIRATLALDATLISHPTRAREFMDRVHEMHRKIDAALRVTVMTFEPRASDVDGPIP